MVAFSVGEFMKDKKEEIYYCFRYRCKNCPKQRECEERAKAGWYNGNTSVSVAENKSSILLPATKIKQKEGRKNG